MRYKYVSHLTDLKDLKHIEWFVAHSEDYEFRTEQARELRDRLKRNIRNKNICYSELVSDYENLVRHFDNDPYHYWFELNGENSNQWTASNQRDHYFVSASDRDGGDYTVPYKYISENQINHDIKEVTGRHLKRLEEAKARAVADFQAVQNHYMKYWVDGGVRDAMERFEGVHNGADYHILRTAILFFVYNVLLAIVLQDSQFVAAVTHFWQLLSSGPNALYSAEQLFPGHKVLGVIALLAVAYFVWLDFVYAYGLYYMIYMKQKYQMVRSYHEGVLRYLEPFQKDFEACRNGVPTMITKVRNRDSVYVPLVVKTARRYNFYVGGAEPKAGDQKKPLLQSVVVPVRSFYSNPIHIRVIWLLIVMVLIRGICHPYNIMLF